MNAPVPLSSLAGNDRPVDVCFFISALQGGGAEKVLIELLRRLVTSQLRVDLVVLRHAGVYKDSVPAGVRYVTLDTRLFSMTKYLRYLRRVTPRCVVSMLENPSLFALTAKVLFAPSHRLIVRVDGKLFWHRSGRALLKRPLDWARFQLGRRLYHRADHVVCVSRELGHHLAQALRLDPHKTSTIYNSVEMPQTMPQARLVNPHVANPLPERRDNRMVVAVGRLVPEKRFDVLIRAFCAVADPAELLILGEGPLRATLEKLVASLNLTGRIHLPGFVGNVNEYLNRADVFVLSSESEGLPTALIEALMLRRPIVSTNCSFGPGEILDHGRFGKLVPVNDTKLLAAAITNQLDNPIEYSTDAWEQQIGLFAPCVVADQYQKLLSDLNGQGIIAQQAQ